MRDVEFLRSRVEIHQSCWVVLEVLDEPLGEESERFASSVAGPLDCVTDIVFVTVFVFFVILENSGLDVI